MTCHHLKKLRYSDIPQTHRNLIQVSRLFITGTHQCIPRLVAVSDEPQRTRSNKPCRRDVARCGEQSPVTTSKKKQSGRGSLSTFTLLLEGEHPKVDLIFLDPKWPLQLRLFLKTHHFQMILVHHILRHKRLPPNRNS